jgi:hypothetical protein
MTIEGLDKLQKHLNDLARKAKELDGTHSIPLNELLTPSFISHHTRFASLAELFEAGGFEAGSKEEFEAIPDDKLDAFIQSESSFQSWQDMVGAAGKEWVAGKMGL